MRTLQKPWIQRFVCPCESDTTFYNTRIMSSTQAYHHVSIINLPDEILLDILGLLHDEHETIARRTLDSRTSRRLHVLAQPLFYRTVAGYVLGRKIDLVDSGSAE
jgi:hypothetical protein